MGQLGAAATVTARGGFITFLGSVLVAVVGAVGTLGVAGLLSPSDFGLYSISILPASLFVMLTDWGIDSALIRFIARYRSNKSIDKTQSLVRVGFLFKLLTSSLMALLLFVSSSWVATALLNRPQITQFVQITAFAIIFQSLYQTSLSSFSGFEHMGRRAVVNVSESVCKAIIPVILILLGLGVTGAILGHVLSFVVGGSIGLFLILGLIRSLPQPQNKQVMSFYEQLKMMTRFGIPIFLGASIGTIVRQFRGIMLPWFVLDASIGNYDVALKFSLLISVAVEAIRVVLYPTYSKFSHETDPVNTQKIYRESVRYATLLVIPWTLLLVTLSQPMVSVLFGSKYPLASQYLVLLLLPSLLVSFGFHCIGGFLNSQGHTKTSFRVELVRFLTSVLLAPLFLNFAGIDGFILSNFIAHFLATLLGFYVIRKKFNVIPDFSHNSRIFISATIAAVVTYSLIQALSSLFSPLLIVICGGGCYLITFLVLAPILGAIKSTDVTTLNFLLRDITPLRPIIRLILYLETKILEIAHPSSIKSSRRRDLRDQSSSSQ